MLNAIHNAKIVTLLIFLLVSNIASATVYQTNEAFLNEVFNGTPPKAKVLWLSKALKGTVNDILQHKPRFLRTRYWKQNDITVWVIDEIGKTQPITIATVIQDNKIVKVKILAFRESRGWEIIHDFFTEQFKGLFLTQENSLNGTIDGISGATLSVNAVRKVTTLALFFNSTL